MFLLLAYCRSSETPAPPPVLTPPPTLAIYYQEGQQYKQVENYNEAIKSFTKYIELNPNNFRAYDERGRAYHELKQYEKPTILRSKMKFAKL